MLSVASIKRFNKNSPLRQKSNNRRIITQSSHHQHLRENPVMRPKHKRLQSHKEYQPKFFKNQAVEKSKFANIYINNAIKNQEASQGSKLRKLILSSNIATMQIQKENNEFEKWQKKNCILKRHRSRTNMQSAKVTFSSGEKNQAQTEETIVNSFMKIRVNQQQKKNQNNSNIIDLEVWKLQVTKICNSLQQLRNFGSVEKKIHKWCANYFQSKKRGLIDIFMRKIYKKKSLNDEVIYFAIMEQQILLSKIIDAIQEMSDKEKYFLGIEITLYRTFLEEKIASKHKLELDQIQDRVRSNIQTVPMKGFARQLYQTINTSPEVIGFFADLQRIEETYGRLNLLSLKNRKRFQNINESQINIKKLIHN